ncbi:ATP-independent periplasmic protein-refolding chaperone [Paramixta manurensis]|uniref:ATP-independent periplasmic protein-refolding chaperone n=1 Tax=Paramixta manurensis TaxID=2740817 RepID=A0A6M8UET5_9GAMM|nr:ATP-independent periplasmic protein-refolding chaperone [Erwiniaceae bacterium PD-1]
MRKLTSLFVATTLALGAANIVHAAADSLTPPPADKAPQTHRMMHHGMYGMHGMFQGLNLTDAQKQQMRTIMKDAHKEMKRPSLEERRANHEIIASDTFDKAKAEEQAAKLTANAKENAVAMMETQNKLYNVLTADQKKQYNANFEKRLTEKPMHHGKMMTPASSSAQ